MFFPERPAEIEPEAAILFGSSPGREGIASVERFITEADVETTVPVFDTRLGQNVYVHERQFMIFGGEVVSVESDLTNLIFGWKLAAAKSVDLERCARACQIAKRLLELLRIVG